MHLWMKFQKLVSFMTTDQSGPPVSPTTCPFRKAGMSFHHIPLLILSPQKQNIHFEG